MPHETDRLAFPRMILTSSGGPGGIRNAAMGEATTPEFVLGLSFAFVSSFVEIKTTLPEALEAPEDPTAFVAMTRNELFIPLAAPVIEQEFAEAPDLGTT